MIKQQQNIAIQLQQLQQIMQSLNLWTQLPPSEKAFSSVEPFAIDTMEANEWLQWVFIPRMFAIIEAKGSFPTQIAVSPYIEEVFKDIENVQLLLAPLIEIEKLCQNQ